MGLELGAEAQAIKDYIIERVASHPTDQRVNFIEFGFQFDQVGFFCVFFDTREDAQPDGTWTMRTEGNSLARDHWVDAIEDQFGESSGTVLGDMIKEVVFGLRYSGAFKSLNKCEGCEFGIEEMCGYYGWPNYEDRGKENTA